MEARTILNELLHLATAQRFQFLVTPREIMRTEKERKERKEQKEKDLRRRNKEEKLTKRTEEWRGI